LHQNNSFNVYVIDDEVEHSDEKSELVLGWIIPLLHEFLMNKRVKRLVIGKEDKGMERRGWFRDIGMKHGA
jgi:hypothetical protein